MSVSSLFAVFTFVIAFSEFMSISIIDSIVKEMGISHSIVGLLLTFYTLGIMILGPIMTIVTSRMDARKLFLWSIFIFSMIGLSITFLNNFTVILFLRFIAGAIHGVYYSVAITLLGEITEKHRMGKVISKLMSAFFAAMMIGLPVGAFMVGHFGFRSAYAVAATLSIICFFLYFRYFPKTKSKGKKMKFKSLIGALLNQKLLVIYGISFTIFASTFITYSFLAPFLKETNSLFTADNIPYVFFVFGLGGYFGSRYAGIFKDRYGTLKTIGVALICYFFIVIIFSFFSQNIIAVFILMFFWAFFVFSINPSTTILIIEVAQKEFPEAGPVIMALNTAITNGGIMLGSFLGGLLLKNHAIGQLPNASMLFVGISILFFILYLKLSSRLKI